MQHVTLIAAMDHGRVIGASGAMPWHLPADFAWFRANTLGKPIVMGRRTYESIGRPLPKRLNIVVTRRRDFDAPGCVVVHDVDEALAAAGDADEVMICGGAQLYEELMPRATRLLVTVVHARLEGDTWFPAFSLDEWTIDTVEHRDADERNAFATSYYRLSRRAAPTEGADVTSGLPAPMLECPAVRPNS